MAVKWRLASWVAERGLWSAAAWARSADDHGLGAVLHWRQGLGDGLVLYWLGLGETKMINVAQMAQQFMIQNSIS